MKKLMIAVAFAAMTAGISASAQNEVTTCDKQCPRTEQACMKDRTKCDKPCAAARPCEFEGLNLNDAQKEQLKALKQEQMSKRQAAREANRAAKQVKKAEAKQARENDRREYLAKVKAVLTPEQYVQYLENLTVRANKGVKKEFRKMDGRFDRSKGRKIEGKGPRGARPAQQQAPAETK